MSSNKEINTSDIDKLQSKIDALLDDDLQDPFSRVGRLQSKINQLHEGDAPENSRLGRLQARINQLDDGFSMKSNRLSRLQDKMNRQLQQIENDEIVCEKEIVEEKQIKEKEIDLNNSLVQREEQEIQLSLNENTIDIWDKKFVLVVMLPIITLVFFLV